MGRKAAALQARHRRRIDFRRLWRCLAHKPLRYLGPRHYLDHLVNNVGHGDMADFAATTEAQFDALFNVHVKGVFFLTQALLPVIADGGRIVNFSSGLTRVSFPGFSA